MKKCVAHTVKLQDFEDRIQDPKLNALLQKGWFVVSDSIVDKDREGPVLLLVLHPPLSEGAHGVSLIGKAVAGLLVLQTLILSAVLYSVS